MSRRRTEINRQMVDALREVLGLDPLYRRETTRLQSKFLPPLTGVGLDGRTPPRGAPHGQ